jgi:hypothetical protein
MSIEVSVFHRCSCENGRWDEISIVAGAANYKRQAPPSPRMSLGVIAFRFRKIFDSTNYY